MYKLKCIIFLLCSCLLLGGCSGVDGKTNSDTGVVDMNSALVESGPEEISGLEDDYLSSNVTSASDLPAIDFSFDPDTIVKQAEPINALLTKQYAESDIVSPYIDIFYSPLQSFAVFLNQIHDKYPIECLRRMDDSRLYAVYKTEEGGYFYLFFDSYNDVLTNTSTDESVVGFYPLSHAIYAKKVLHYVDFSGIQAGTSIQEVEKVDPAVSVWISANANKTSEDTYLTTRHLLTDGLLVISYKAMADEELYVTDIQYYPDFILSYSEGTGETAYTIEYDYSILQGDYPA